MIKKTLLIFLALYSLSAYAQLEFSGEVTTEGYYTTGGELPFWMYHNKRGRISEGTNVAGWVSGKAVYNFGAASSLEAGAGVLYQDGIGDNIFLDEVYLQFRNEWLQVIGGRKQKEELYNGLSATNENILWSLNARPLPGLQISTTRPIMIFPEAGIGFEASLEEYLLEKDRHVRNARVHHKSFHLVYQPSEAWRIRAGIQHFAQWGGYSATKGKQPKGIIDYIKIFAGREGGENADSGDQANVLGNHLGSYELYVAKQFSGVEVELIYNHIFEDGSGSRYANFPDGRYGVYVDLNDKKQFLNNFLYEFYYTRNQSRTPPHPFDYYFNNFIYANGWTYNEEIIGLPFFSVNYYEDYPLGSKVLRVGNNSVLVHHIGVSGNIIQNLPFNFLVSYRKNYGHYKNVGVDGYEYYPPNDPRARFKISSEVLSSKIDVEVWQRFINFNLTLAADLSSEVTHFGAGVSLSKKF